MQYCAFKISISSKVLVLKNKAGEIPGADPGGGLWGLETPPSENPGSAPEYLVYTISISNLTNYTYM